MPDTPWTLSLGYDYRFGTVGFSLHREGEELHFYVPLQDLIKQLGVKKHEMDAMFQSEYEWTEKAGDIDPARIRLLEETDFAGKVVLDIGGYDGFAAEIALQRGAARAICLDNHQFEHYGWDEKKKEGVEYVQGDFMDLMFQTFGTTLGTSLTNFGIPDTIIFFNVLYHLRSPMAALDHLRSLLKPDGEMLLCTLVRYHEGSWIYLYEPRECNPTDETVFFGPSLEALERMLKLTGWQAERYALAYDRVLYRCKPIPDFEPILAKAGYARA